MANEMEVYHLTVPSIIGFETPTSIDQDDFDNFSSTPPVVMHKRPNQDVGVAPAKSLKKSKSDVIHQQTPKKITIQKCASPAKKDKQAQSPEKPRKQTVKQNHMLPHKKEQSQVEVNQMRLRCYVEI
ncbi:hypothetical protein HAX54_035605 [Datura stramonium]|uniref:Uncharacterized protein n=1 Tax=Datura stramonium TaxID=4076 RepID=A0ABS8VJF5_DATST|nr:hypothetical protein [Datura stramonium]